MKRPQTSNNSIEEQLADFTDSMLEADEEEAQPSSPNPDLRVLQETVLSLKNAVPKEDLSEATIHRMRQNVLRRWRQQEDLASQPFWKRLFSVHRPSGQRWLPQEIRRRRELYIYLATGFLLLLVCIPLIDKVGSAQPAASGQNLNITIFIAFAGIIFLVLWLFRSKR